VVSTLASSEVSIGAALPAYRAGLASCLASKNYVERGFFVLYAPDLLEEESLRAWGHGGGGTPDVGTDEDVLEREEGMAVGQRLGVDDVERVSQSPRDGEAHQRVGVSYLAA